MNFAALAWPARRPLAAVGMAVVAAAFAAASAARLRPDTSITSFFPRHNPAALALNRVLGNFPTVEKLMILVTTPGDSPEPEALLKFADSFKNRIARAPAATALITDVTYRVDAQSREFVANVIAPNGLFYLDDASFVGARLRLTRESMAAQLRQDEAILAAPGPAAGAISKAILQDPLRLHEFIQDKLAAAQPMKTYQHGDALISPDGRSLLIGVTGAKPPNDLDFCRTITAVASQIADDVNTEHLKVEISGAYAIATQSEKSIRRDSISSVIGSVICLALLFAVTFRSPIRLFAITFTPLAFGILCGFGIYAVFSRSVSPLTAVIGAMLAGIGIDYSIFYLVHILEKRAAGMIGVDATRHAIDTIGSPLLAAWVTSVVGFIAVGFASVQVLRDFSIAGSLGLMGALLGAGFLLPALLVLVERWTRRSKSTSSGPAIRWSIKPLVDAIDRHAGRCLIFWAVVLIAVAGVFAVAGVKLPLETDPTVLHPRPNPPLDAEAEIARKMGGVSDSLIVYLKADTPDRLLTLAHRVNNQLSTPAARNAGVASSIGLANLIPDPSVVEQRLREIGPSFADRVTADFDAAVADSAFNPESFAPYRSFLRTLLTRTSAPTVNDLVPYRQLGQTFLPRPAFDGAAPLEAITLVFLRPPGSGQAMDETNVDTLRNLLRGIDGATLTGMTVLSLDTQATIRRDLPRLIAAAVAFIAVYLLLYFRSIPHALLALLPTACSLAFLLAAAKLTGAKLNLANIVSIPLLIGVDSDYGIFLVSVARRCSSRAELRQRVVASGQSVLLCAAATLLGFGSLAFTSVPAIRSLGWAVAIGVSVCAAASIFLLLPLLLWMSGRIPKTIAQGSGGSAVIGVLFLAAIAGGCSPPSARLTFPDAPIHKTAESDWYDVHHNGRAQFGIAHDSSGRVNRLLYDDSGSGHVDREYRLSDYANDRVPHLILLLDSIPFETMKERYDGGDLRWFDPPQKMIAPFPSLTEVCYSDVLHAPPLPGFIDEYFDPRDEKRKGILWNRVRGFRQPWERRLDYTASFAAEGLSFLHPDGWFDAELELARRTVDESPNRVMIVYIASAAPMVCKYGKWGAERVLDGVRQLCLQLLYERRGAIKISMMADHGHNYMPSRNFSLDKILTTAGFHPADKIRGDKDCVVEINALVTCAAVDTLHPAEIAAVLCQHEQIEMAIYSDGPRTIIRTAAGSAAVECRGGRLRYVPIDADVLAYEALIARLKAEGTMDADGFASDEIWFNQTVDEYWPNAPRSVWDSLHGHFINTPTILLSIKDGYYSGLSAYEKYIKMASTHGGLNQINCATFVMTMTGRLKGPVRHEDVLGVLQPGFEPRVLR